ncbi:TetR/AcrR family transcriptional regulator [Algoriphagus namhaensis]
MGISDRKEREKEELKTAILQAAKKLFLEKGVEKTSMRNIADEIEYSPGIIYHHFKDKDAIFHALHQEGFLMMNGRMKVLAAVSDPLERLKAMGKIYIDFALENPDMYDLMFIKEAPMHHIQEEKDENWKEGGMTFDGLRQTIQQCIDRGHFKGMKLEPLAYMIWSTVHGMVSLSIRHRCDVVNCDYRDTIVEQGLASLYDLIDRMR